MSVGQTEELLGERDRLHRHQYQSPRECPLPTYDEVCGHVSYKAETSVCATPTSLLYQHREDRPARYSSADKKVVAIILLGLILIPLCAMIITIQIKVCTLPSKNELSPPSISDRTNVLYGKCIDEKNDFQRRLKDYEGTEIEKEKLESRIQELEQWIQTINEEKDYLEDFLKNAYSNKTLDSRNVTGNDTQTDDSIVPIQKDKSSDDITKKMDEILNRPVWTVSDIFDKVRELDKLGVANQSKEKSTHK